MARNDLDTACAAFEESNRLDPGPGAIGNLALCEEQRGHLSSAWQWFVQTLGKLPHGDSRRVVAEQHIADLKQRVPVLTIRLAPGAPKGSVVVRDSTELQGASLGTPLPVDPGVHHVVVSAPGRAEKQYAIELHERESKEVLVEPGTPVASTESKDGVADAPAADSPPSHDAEAANGSNTKRTVGYVVGGVGVAGIGTSLVLGGLALGKKSTVQSECDVKARLCDSQNGADAAASGHTLATASTVSFVVGALATGVGAYLLLSSGSEPRTTVGAVVLPAGGFLNMQRSF